MFFPLYRLPALPILPVNSIFFTDLPENLKPGKSSTPDYCSNGVTVTSLQ